MTRTGRRQHPGNRGVSEVMGFILIFGIVVISWTVYQGVVVPEQNHGVEFKHNQQVQDDFQDLRNAILTSASTGTTQTAPITLGASYPDRTLAMNLGVSAGAVATVEYQTATTIRIEGAEAVDPFGEVDDYWNGSPHAFESRAITYRPVYSFYTSPPETVYENTVVYNRFSDDTDVTVAGQSLVDGRRLGFVAIGGTLSESGQRAVSVTAVPVSASTNRIAVRNESHPITVLLPTRLDADTWEDLLEEELVGAGGHVVDVRQENPQRIAIDLEAGVTYQLQAARIDVGSGSSPEPSAYLAVDQSPGTTVIRESPYTVVIGARDRFNNPVAGEEVSGEIDGGTFANGESTAVVNTSVNGDARFAFTPETNETVELKFAIGGGSGDYETVQLSINAVEGGAGDGDGDDDDDDDPFICNFLPGLPICN